MDALRRSGQDLSARELSDVVGLPKSTAQRLLQTLQACELLHQDSTTRKYGLGPETLCLGMAYLRRVNVRDCARPHMIRLCDRTGETVGLTVRAGADRTYIDQVEPQSELRATNEIGSPYPLWSGAPGRVLLAAMPREEILRLITQTGETAFAHASPPTLDGLLASLEKRARKATPQPLKKPSPASTPSPHPSAMPPPPLPQSSASLVQLADSTLTGCTPPRPPSSPQPRQSPHDPAGGHPAHEKP